MVLSRRRVTGFTLTELMIALSTTVMLLFVTFAILQNSTQVWRRVSGDQNASGQLLKAESLLRRDLFATSFQTVRTAGGPVTLAGSDGDALWFLSAVDPATNEFIRNDDGSPRWQRNILYYSVVPSGLSVNFSGSGINSGGYEVSHPHKVLVRKVIDIDPPTTPADAASQESLIADASPYLERPDKYSFPANDSETVSIVARDLLSFRVLTDPLSGGVSVMLQSANVEEAAKTFPIGSASLDNPQFLVERRFDTYPENQQALGTGAP
jgi:type II secretory pathway component PulJ